MTNSLPIDERESFYLQGYEENLNSLDDLIDQIVPKIDEEKNLLNKKISSIFKHVIIFSLLSLIISASPIPLLPILKAKNITHLILFSKSISIRNIIILTTSILGIFSISLSILLIIQIHKKNLKVKEELEKINTFNNKLKTIYKNNLTSQELYNLLFNLIIEFQLLNNDISTKVFNESLTKNLTDNFASKNIFLLKTFFITTIEKILELNKTQQMQQSSEEIHTLQNNKEFLEHYNESSIFLRSDDPSDDPTFNKSKATFADLTIDEINIDNLNI